MINVGQQNESMGPLVPELPGDTASVSDHFKYEYDLIERKMWESRDEKVHQPALAGERQGRRIPDMLEAHDAQPYMQDLMERRKRLQSLQELVIPVANKASVPSRVAFERAIEACLDGSQSEFVIATYLNSLASASEGEGGVGSISRDAQKWFDGNVE